MGPKPGRPKKRHITRWNDDLDELLLITIHSVCSHESVKLPWPEIAKEMSSMGHSTTEGAIIQHLAKIRQRREQGQKDVPVPLKRGFTGGTSRATRRTKSTRPKNQRSSADTSDEELVERESSPQSNAAPTKRSTRPRKRPISDDDEYVDDADYADDVDTSDQDLISDASFLDFPNAKHEKGSDNASAHTPRKIVTYRCPKAFLAGLGKHAKAGQQYDMMETRTMPDAVMKEDSMVEYKPGVMFEPDVEPFDHSPMNRNVWNVLPEDPFVDSKVMPAGYDAAFGQAVPCHITFQHPAVQPQMATHTTYVPTGNPALDLPSIGEVFSNSAAFTDPLPPLQGFQDEQYVLPDQEFQEIDEFQNMLGEYYIQPDNLLWYDQQAPQ